MGFPAAAPPPHPTHPAPPHAPSLHPPPTPPHSLADLSLKTLKLFGELPDLIDADFYFKIDDDVGVNVPALAEYLEERRTQGNLYLVR